MSRTFRAVLLASLAAAGLAGASLAQQPPARPGPPFARGAERPALAERQARMAERLRDVLQLRRDQEPALNALLAAMAPPAGARQGLRARRQEMRELSTPERLDRRRAMMAERQRMFETRSAAIKRFYAQLTPGQQRAFDAMGPMGRGGRGLRPRGQRPMDGLRPRG